MSVEVRVRVQVAGEVLLGEWESVPVERDVDDAALDGLRDAVRDSVAQTIRAPGVFTVRLAEVTRHVSGRYIEWVDVEVRRLAEWISTREAAELLGVSRQRVLQLRDEHDGFPAPRGDEHRFEWPRAELVAWQEARRAGGAQA